MAGVFSKQVSKAFSSARLASPNAEPPGKRTPYPVLFPLVNHHAAEFACREKPGLHRRRKQSRIPGSDANPSKAASRLGKIRARPSSRLTAKSPERKSLSPKPCKMQHTQRRLPAIPEPRGPFFNPGSPCKGPCFALQIAPSEPIRLITQSG